MGEETVDAYGTPVQVGDWVVALGDPNRVALVAMVAGRQVTVRHGDGEPWTLRSRQVQVVTLRDAAGAVIVPGCLVRGRGDRPGAVTGRVVAVLYRAYMITVDVGGPVTALTVPALVTVVGVDTTVPAGRPEPGVRVADSGAFTVPVLGQLARDVDVILAGGVPCAVVPEPRAAG